jgi:hypothetical protein
MDRSLAAALTRPRHVALSLLLFLALGGGGGAIIGFAQAASDGAAAESAPNALPLADFTLAVPMAGDRGLYELQALEGHTLDQAQASSGFRSLAFDWLGAQVLRNEAGDAEWGNLVRHVETDHRQYADGTEETVTDDEVYAIRPGTEEAFAYIRVRDDAEVDDEVARRTVGVDIHFSERPRTLPPGFATVLHGQTVQVPSGELPTPETCDGCGGMRPDSRRVLEAVTAAEVDGVRYLRAEIVDYYDGGLRTYRLPNVELLYREDVPYPIRIHEESRPYAIVLSNFERGSEELRRVREVVAGPPAPLEFAPLTPWGPDATGVERPLPPQQAYELARDDVEFTALRDFLASHPGAYLGELRGREMVDQREGATHSWTFGVTDGKDLLTVHVDAREPATRLDGVPPVPTPVPYNLPYTPTTRLSAEDIEAVEGRYPVPGAVEGRLVPTVASMMEQWRVYATEEYAARPAIDWGFSLECTYDWDTRQDDCSRSTVRVAAGFQAYNRTYPAEPLPVVVNPANPADSLEDSHLHWIDLPGRPDLTFDSPYYYSDSRTDWRRDGQVPELSGAPKLPSSSSSGAIPLTVAGGAWVFPEAEAAAAVGLGALLVSLLFYLKPALKAGFVGLFSRVRTDNLLDDPTRALLLAAVEAEPGIHHQALVRLAGKGNGATEHHLQKLVAGGLLNRHRSDGYTCYFRAGKVDRRSMATAHLLKSPVARAVVEAATSRPGTSLAQVAREQGVSGPTVHYHAKRLQAAGLVRWEGGLHAGSASAGGAATAAA